MNWSERLWKDRELVGKKVTEILEEGIPQGKSMQDMARDLKNATNSSFNDAFRLIRTESAHVDGEVLLESFKQAKAELGYTKYIFDATIDNRTSDDCERLDGKVIPIDEAVIGENFPPVHPNCRSTCVLDESSIDQSLIEDSKQEEKEEEKQQEQTTEKTSTVEKVEKSEVLKALEESNIERLPFEEFKQMPTVDEIIERVGGGDMTKGSCSSLAFCYAGNRGKYKVLDFRDGASREFFSKNGNILKIANLEGVESLIEKEYNDFVAVNKLLYYTVKNKEYYLSTGQHAAIIRRLDKGFEYLELQSATDNGFKKLTKDVLKNRFKCQKSHTISGIKAKASSALIDIETLAKNAEFKEMLEYINTDIKKQKKGIKGFAK
jgi:SPP1 gp7 family putative phage head morphogenesis protein